ncbi:fructosamine kinase family protein [Sphingomonas sp. RS6]
MYASLLARASAALGKTATCAAPLAGGDLSSVHRLRLADGGSAIAKQGPMVSLEAEMLEAIAVSGAPAPDVLAVTDDLLLLVELPGGGGPGGAWDSLTAALSRLHAARGRRYGWHADYAFGAVSIPNGDSDDWPSFWADHRLRCHLPHLSGGLARRIEALADRLPELLPANPPPSLLHGDLWGGNVLAAEGRVTGLIDPASYYGDREVDAAMLTLFDHPPVTFFDALELAPGWRDRQPIYRLWPLLVHLRLFGASYLGAVEGTLAEIA